jgi:hypothetical protein
VSIVVHGVEDTQNTRLERWDDFMSRGILCLQVRRLKKDHDGLRKRELSIGSQVGYIVMINWGISSIYGLYKS